MLKRLKSITAENALIVLLVLLGIVNAKSTDAWLQLLIAPVTAGAIDFLLGYAKTKKAEVPKLAIISGLIIALVLEPAPMRASLAALVAMASKHVIARHGRNIFNPAAFGLVITMLAFSTQTAWWGAGSILAAAGIAVAFLLRRLETAFAFLLVYALGWSLFGAYTPLDFTIYFFAFVMVIEPVTTPATFYGKIAFGAFVALLTVALIPVASVDILLLSLLIANIFTPFFNRIKRQPPIRRKRTEPSPHKSLFHREEKQPASQAIEQLPEKKQHRFGFGLKRHNEGATKETKPASSPTASPLYESAKPPPDGSHGFRFPKLRHKAATKEAVASKAAFMPLYRETEEPSAPKEPPQKIEEDEEQEEPLFEEGELDRTKHEIGEIDEISKAGPVPPGEDVKRITEKKRKGIK